MHQPDYSSLGAAIPNTPLRAVDLTQSMSESPTIHTIVDALRELLEIRKSHRDVDPIQYTFSLWRNLLVNGPQPSIAIGKNRDRSSFVDSALPQRKSYRAHRLGISIAHRSKACGMSVAIQRLAGNDLKVSFWPLVPICGEGFRQLLKSFAHLHRPVAHGAGS